MRCAWSESRSKVASSSVASSKYGLKLAPADAGKSIRCDDNIRENPMPHCENQRTEVGALKINSIEWCRLSVRILAKHCVTDARSPSMHCKKNSPDQHNMPLMPCSGLRRSAALNSDWMSAKSTLSAQVLTYTKRIIMGHYPCGSRNSKDCTLRQNAGQSSRVVPMNKFAPLKCNGEIQFHF